MIYAGLDVGSRTTVLALVDAEGGLGRSTIVDSGVNPLRRCQELLAGTSYHQLMLTGYGRHLVAPVVGGETVSEITAGAIGARYLNADCRMVIDVGGQDSKVTVLSPAGDVVKFEMNDRCAAGTGRFLEVMAGTLEVPLAQLGLLALGATREIRINSLCTVFAESEVISLIARGEEAGAIALALHEAIATRISGMARRVGVQPPVFFAGGGALNPCLHHLLAKKLGFDVAVPPDPQVVPALGAALLARRIGAG